MLNKVLLSVLVAFSSIQSYATGPSTAEAYIVPIARNNDGAVLFKTYYSINEIGASMQMPIQLGWLVVSADSIWEEVEYKYLKVEEGIVTEEEENEIKKFKAPFDWKNIPSELKPLMAKHNLYYPINKTIGKDTLSWTRWGLYQQGTKISDKTEMKSIANLKGVSSDGRAIRVSFYYKGIALFHCTSDFDEEDEEEHYGAVFFRDMQYPIGYYSVDGIMIFKKEE